MEREVEFITRTMTSGSFRPPMLPVVAEEALRLGEDPDASLRDMIRLIERDSVLAAKFLALANSSMYRGMLPALAVETALTRMGMTATRDVLLFAVLEPLYFNDSRLAREFTRVRTHSLATSQAAALVAEELRIPSREVTLPALVHDIGTIALLKLVADHAARLPLLFQRRDFLVQVMHDVHTAAGGLVAERWALPRNVYLVISQHHEVLDLAPPLVRVVAAADDLASRAGAPGLESPPEGALEAVLGANPRIDSIVKRLAKMLADRTP